MSYKDIDGVPYSDGLVARIRLVCRCLGPVFFEMHTSQTLSFN